VCDVLTDEQLARQLQEQEQEGSASVPNLQEIMDMDKALALYRREEVLCLILLFCTYSYSRVKLHNVGSVTPITGCRPSAKARRQKMTWQQS